MIKTKPCDRAHAAGRLGVAESFMEPAESPDLSGKGGSPYRANARVANYVQARIAASDAICCIDLREHSSADNHAAAIELIKKVARDGAVLAKALGTLLAVKTEASYGSAPMKADKATRARRAAETLVQAARDRLTSSRSGGR